MAQKYTVFLVDDDKFLLEMYKKKFEQNGAEVTIAQGSNEALAKLREGIKPTIIILDVILPEIDGLELLKIIRKEELSPDSTVIMLTNESNVEKIEEAKHLGIKGYIIKATSIPSEAVEKALKIAGLSKDQ